MAHDLVIRGGTLVDGTGAPATTADVAIDGDRVVEVGRVVGSGRHEIDADGLVVTPGFVDIHTHLDAQMSWDPIGSSSCWHGVTSVVLGNCGVTFAPVLPGGREFLAEMMESVEDIPAQSILDGLSWNWETYGEYLADVAGLSKGVNVGGMVGHCAVRVAAMGERSLDEDPATAEDIAAMVPMVDEALAAGALGFSSSRTFLHRVPDGRYVPGTHAAEDELLAFADSLGRYGGIFECAPKLGGRNDPDGVFTRDEIRMYGEISRRAGCPVTFGLTQVDIVPDMHLRVLDYVATENADGARIRPQTTSRQIGILFGLSGRTPFDRADGWDQLADLPPASRSPRRGRRWSLPPTPGSSTYRWTGSPSIRSRTTRSAMTWPGRRASPPKPNDGARPSPRRGSTWHLNSTAAACSPSRSSTNAWNPPSRCSNVQRS